MSISPVSSSSISIPQGSTPPSQSGQTPQSTGGAQALSSHKSHGHHHDGGAQKAAATPTAMTPSDPKALGANLNVTT